MSKKNKHRPQGSRGSAPPPAPAAPVVTQPEVDALRQVEEIALEADVAIETAQVDVAAVTLDGPPAGRALADLLRDAEGARRKFEAARQAVEKKQAAMDEARREADMARARAEEAETRSSARAAEFDRREQTLLERADALAVRERDADAGFLARRRELLQPLEDERAALQQELARLRASATEERARLDAEFRGSLDAQERQWQEAATRRALDAERQRKELDESLASARESLLADARRQAAEVVAQAERRAEAEGASLDAREASLRERERGVRAERDRLAAVREVLDEDRAAFEQRVERRAGAALAERAERIAELEQERDRARRERDALHARVVAFEDLERRLGGRSPEEVLRDQQALREECERLRRDLAERPTEAERVRLAALERDATERDDRERGLRAEIAALKTRLARREVAAVELETLRDQKEALEASRALLKTAHDELRAEVDSLTKKDDAKNPMAALVALDRDATAPSTGFVPTSLREFADDLRARLTHAVEGRVLHYGARDVRSFLGGMAMTPLLLLQGISGTGKTSLPIAVANALGGDHTVIEVQAGWRDRQDLLGYYNAFHRHFYATNFLQALYRAGTEARRDRVTLIVLDEINLSRVEQFFADFLSVMEKPESERRVTLMSDPVPDPPALLVEGRHLPIPRNVWFVGTANHDETTTAFADKTYDRAHVMDLPRHPPSGDPRSAARPDRAPVSHRALRKLFDDAMTSREGEAKRARAWFDAKGGVGDLLRDEFRLSWGNRHERDIERYVPVVCEAGGELGEAVDHLLHTKLLRKLRDRHDVRAQGLERLRAHLTQQWLDPKGSPERSLELIETELRAKRAGDVS